MTRNKLILIVSGGGYALQDLTQQGTLSAYNYDANTGQAYLMQDKDKNFVDDEQRAV